MDGGDDAGDGMVQLSDAIGLVRDQLIAAQQAGSRTVGGQVVRFAVGKVSIEFVGEVRRSSSVQGEAGFWVLTAAAGGEQSSAARQRVVVELLPIGPDGAPTILTDPSTR